MADANPPPTYSWLLPNGTVSEGKSVSLTNLEVGDNGTYTCLVYNIYKQVNHTANETVYIDVRKYSFNDIISIEILQISY
jgi:uncharacterized repeat protein (TIGR01451 family)